MSFSSTNPVTVNSYTTGQQNTAVTIALAGGGWVTLFNSDGQDGSGTGIYSQAYNASGVAVGGQQQVNSHTQSNQEEFSVTALPDGTYVVAWTDYSGDTDGTAGITMRKYAANGTPITGEIDVNSTVTGSQVTPQITSLANGGWLVTWVAYSQTYATDPFDGSQFLVNDQRVYQQAYSASGVKVGGEVLVGSPYPVPLEWPVTVVQDGQQQVTSLSDGGWVVTWHHFDPNALEHSIQSQAYNADGSQKAGLVTVSDESNPGSPFTESTPQIVELAGGGWVMTWVATQLGEYKIAGQVFDASGTKVGGQFEASDSLTGVKESPQVIALADGGFVVGWQAAGGSDSFGKGLYVRSYDADGTARDSGSVQVNTYFAHDEINMSLAALDSGGFVAVYYSAYDTIQPDGSVSSDADIYQQVFGADGSKVDAETYITGVQGIQYGPLGMEQLGGDKWVITYNTKNAGSGTDIVQKTVTFVHAAPEGQSTKVVVDPTLQHVFSIADFGFSDQDGDVLASVKIVSVDNGGVLKLNGVVVQPGTVIAADQIPQLTWVGKEGEPFSGKIGFQVTDSGGTAHGSANVDTSTNYLTLAVPVVDASDEIHVGSLTSGNQQTPNVIALPDGGYVTVWNSTNGSSSEGIYFQQFDSQGQAAGQETLVSDDKGPLFQYNRMPSIALLEKGGWVIAWQANDGDFTGIYAKQYDINGNAVGNQIAVNAFVTGSQTNPLVTGLDNGGWVVEWSGANSTDTSGVIQRIFDENGQTVGALNPAMDLSVNTFTTGTQYLPEITKLTTGGWVSTWISLTQDPDGSSGVYQQVYSSAGVPVGPETRVHTFTTGSQAAAHTVAVADGGWVVVWQTNLLDGDKIGVFAQAFDKNGGPVGAETQVNTFTTGIQSLPVIAALEDGGWVVCWQSFAQDGDSNGVYLQRYGSDGLPVGSEIRVNSETAGAQFNPIITSLSDGGWVVVWSSDLQDGDGYGVYQQVYNANGSAAGGETRVNTFTAGPQTPLKVTALSDGGWVVTWNSDGQDGDGKGIYQKVFHHAPNHAPFGADVEIATDAGAPYHFNAQSFPFADIDSDGLQAVVIDTISGGGTLKLNGVVVAAGQTVLATDLANLVWTPPASAGVGHSTVTFSVIDDGGTANGGINKDTTPNTITFNINPQLDNPIADQAVIVGNSLNFVVPADAFADFDSDSLTFAATLPDGGNLPAWLSFDPVTRTFSGAPTAGSLGTFSVLVKVSDGHGGEASDIFDITVSLANNNPATITGTSTANIAEDQVGTVGGDLDVTDPDPGEAVFQTPASLLGQYGAFTFDNTTGAWTYDVDSTKAEVQALNNGEKLTDTLMVKSFDGSATQAITVTVNGANEGGNNPATITGTTLALIGEDDLSIVSGKLAITDPDPGEAIFQMPASLVGAHGTWTFDSATGDWTYDVDNSKPSIQALQTGQTTKDVLTVTSLDGTATQKITVVIIGADEPVNNPATITGTATASIGEDQAGTVGGDLDISDLDPGQAIFLSPPSLGGLHGTFTFNTSSGLWTYDVDSTKAEVQALNVGETLTDSLTVKSFDGSATQVIVVTINGADEIGNTPATITGTATASIGEDQAGTVGGDLNVTDPDPGEAIFQTPASLAGQFGTFTFDSVSGAWSYDVDSSKAGVQALNDGETLTDTLTVKSFDGTASQTITVTIDGATDVVNNPATITGTANANIGEDQFGLVSGDLDIADADPGEATFQTPASLQGAHGIFTFDPASGFWTYDLDSSKAAVQALNTGETLTDTLTVKSLDGSATQVITVTIDGSTDVVNNPATITGVASANIGEDQQGTVGGDLDVTDIDLGEASFQTPASLQGAFGIFTFSSATGAWTYDVDNSLAEVQALNTGETLTDTLTVKSFDGSASQDIVVTINGADEVTSNPATITGTAKAIIGEDQGGTVGGDLDVADADPGEAKFQTPASLTGQHGVFTFDNLTGVWTYDVDSARAEVQALNTGETLTDSLTVKSFDGSATQVITVTIDGADEVTSNPATITGTATANIGEDQAGTVGGDLDVTDADPGEAVFQTPASLAGQFGTFTFDNVTGAWTYDVNSAKAEVQALHDGETLIDTLTITSFDGSASQDITVTIDGANDAPVADNPLPDHLDLQEGVVFAFTIPDNAYSDAEDDQLDITLDPALPAWIDFDPVTWTFSGTPPAGLTNAQIAFTIDDGHGGLLQQFVALEISPATTSNPATITGTATAMIGEDDPGTVGGDLDVTDPDAGEAMFQTPASLAGLFGTFTFDNLTGAWTYDVDSTLGAVQALNTGDTLTDTLTVTSFDGSASQVITVTINGADETTSNPATITGTATAMIGEDDPAIVGGDLDVADLDAGEAIFQTPASLAGLFGTFTFDNLTGAWTYDVDSSLGAVQALNTGDTLTDTLTVTSFDGSATQVITVTINGADETTSNPATITGTATGHIGEDQAGFIVGDLSIADLDAGEAIFQTPASLAGLFGTFTFDPETGTWTYDVDSSLAEVQALNNGEILTDSLTVTSFDGSASQVITVTIDGADEIVGGATITGVANGTIGEDDPAIVGGDLDISDPDIGDDVFQTPDSLEGGYGAFTFDPDSGAWSYDLENANPAVQALKIGDILTDSLTVTSKDGSASQVITVTITGSNDAPVVSLPLFDQAATEINAFSYTIPAGSFSDIDAGTVLELSATLQNGDDLPLWLSFNPVSGTFTGTPPEGSAGAITVTVTASDGETSVSDDIVITIVDDNVGTDGNTAPLVVNPLADQAAVENNAFSFAVPAGSFVDADPGDVLVYSATQADGSDLPDWLIFDASSQTFTGTPPEGSAGTVQVRVTVFDGQVTTSDDFDIAISDDGDGGGGGNIAPVVVNPIADQSVVELSAFSLTVSSGTFFDAEGDDLTLTATLANGDELPDWLSFDGATFTGTPPDGSAGTLSVKVTAFDGTVSTFDSFDITIVDNGNGGGNNAPVVSHPLVDQAAVIGNAFSFAVQAGAFVDADGDELSYAATLADGSELPTWLSFNIVTQTFTGTPPAGSAGTISVMVTASDGQASASDVFDIAINEAEAPVGDNIVPVVVNPLGDQAVVVGNAFSYDMPSNTFFDGNGDALSYTATLFNGDPLPAWLSFDAVNGIFTGTPPDGSEGAVAIKVTASDGQSSTFDSFYIAVNATDVSVGGNAVPVVVVALLDQAATEGSMFAFVIPDGAFMDADPLDTLSYTASLANGFALPDWLEFDAATQTFTGTPPAGSAGALSVKVTASDGKSTTFDTFDLVVAPFNAGNVAPEWDNALENVHARIDRLFTFVIPADAVSDADIGDTLAFSAKLINGDPLPDWLHFNPATKTFSGTPADTDAGVLVVSITATDSGGLTATEEFLIMVDTLNGAPHGSNTTIKMLEDTVHAFTVDDFGYWDTDGDVFAGVIINTLPTNGVLAYDGVPVVLGEDPFTVLAADLGKLTWTPSPNGAGKGLAGFMFQVMDDGDTGGGNVNIDQSPNFVVFDVVAVADAPTVGAGIADLAIATGLDFSLTIPAGAFIDPDAGEVLTYAAELVDDEGNSSPLPGWLQFDGATGTFWGKPDAEAIATLNIKVTVTDSTSQSVSDIFVLAVGDNKPLGINTTITLLEDGSHAFTAADFGFEDVDGDLLDSVIIDTLPLTGTLTLDGEAVVEEQVILAADIEKLMWKPADNANGTGLDSLKFVVQTMNAIGELGTDPKANTITFDVTPVNDAPDGGDKVLTAIEETAYHFKADDFVFLDAADNNALLSVVFNTLPTKGVLQIVDDSTATPTITNVVMGQEVAIADLEKLVWTGGDKDAVGKAYTSLTYSVRDNGGTENGGVDLDGLFNTLTFDIEDVVDIFRGTKRNDTMLGTDGNDVFYSKGGRKDTLTGGGGSDTFFFNTKYKKDIITDFDAKFDPNVEGDTHDIINLHGLKSVKNWNDLSKNHMTQKGDDVVINGKNGDVLTLKGVDIQDLDATDFIF